MTSWSVGRLLIWDVSIYNTYAVSYASLCRIVGDAAAKPERDKCAQALAVKGGYVMRIFAIETSGVCGKEAYL